MNLDDLSKIITINNCANVNVTIQIVLGDGKIPELNIKADKVEEEDRNIIEKDNIEENKTEENTMFNQTQELDYSSMLSSLDTQSLDSASSSEASNQLEDTLDVMVNSEVFVNNTNEQVDKKTMDILTDNLDF